MWVPNLYPDDMDGAEQAGDCLQPTAFDVVEPDPVFTGLFDSNGKRIVRHPVVMRFGFHPADRQFYCPTLEDEDPGDATIVGWSYAAH